MRGSDAAVELYAKPGGNFESGEGVMKFVLVFLSSRIRRQRAAMTACWAGLLIFAGMVRGQESSSRPDTSTDTSTLPSAPVAKGVAGVTAAPVAAGGPVAALRDVLLAACSQDGSGFSRFLTERSKESFRRLTPAARVALMKRFVLLNVPGKSSSTANPAGRPLVRCETPDVTTEMAIGGADVQENIAFLPMELRDAADSTGVSVHQINMGLVREGGQWRLLSIGLLLLDLPSLEVEWDAAEADGNEGTALENLKKLGEAVEAYRRTYSSLPESLTALGPPAAGAPTHEAAGLVDTELAAGAKDGYVFRIVIAGASALGAPAKYELAATPSEYGRTGTRSFFRDANGGWHAGDHRGGVGAESDPKIN
jgi:hypothetical protein